MSRNPNSFRIHPLTKTPAQVVPAQVPAVPLGLTTPPVTVGGVILPLDKVSAVLNRPGFIRDVLAPAVWDMFQHLHSSPDERRARLTLALLTIMEKGDDYLWQHYSTPGNLLKYALDNPMTDAAQARLASDAAVRLSDAVQTVFEALKPVYDRIWGARDS